MAKFLNTEVADDKFSIIGYQVDKTLSDYGTVSRGVCEVDENGDMVAINERLKVYFAKDGSVVYEEDGVEHPLLSNTPVSMNFWGFTPAVFTKTEPLFKAFVEANQDNS